jgi:predicted TIM-barrel fold metal-dependent hydrolase
VKLVDLEAHFYNPGYVSYLRSRTEPPREELVDGEVRVWKEPSEPDRWHVRTARHSDRMADLADARIAEMDEAGVDIQVLSLAAPGCEQFDAKEGTLIAQRSNDELAEAIALHPDRFVGFAALAPLDPAGAADELERCVTELGFKGAKINSHIGDTYLDDERYLPLWERAAGLGVPINLHPIVPHESMVKPYTGYGWALVGPGLGYGAETAVHAMRLVFSGLFDRFPEQQIILGHMGEGLYFWLYRLDFDFKKKWLDAKTRTRQLEKLPSDYLRDNFHVTISGNFLTTAFIATFNEIGSDRVMYASDYPFESMAEGAAFLDTVPIAPADREKVAWRNAARLLKL